MRPSNTDLADEASRLVPYTGNSVIGDWVTATPPVTAILCNGAH